MVRRRTPSVLAENECEYLANFELDEYQRAVRRFGFQRLEDPEPWQANGDVVVGGPYFFFGKTGIPHLLVVTSKSLANTSLYDYNFVDPGFFLVGELDDTIGINEFDHVTFVPFGDDIIIVHPNLEPPRRLLVNDPFPNTIDQLGGNPPRATTGAAYYNHLFLASADIPTRVFYSATADADNGYAATNFLFDAIPGGDVSAVTSFLSLERELIIGKENSVTSLHGSSPQDFSQPQNQASYTGERGPAGPMCMVEVNNRPWILSRDGVWSITGPYALREESYNVDAYFGGDKNLSRYSILHYDAIRHALTTVLHRTFLPSSQRDILTGYPGRGRDGLSAWTEFFSDTPHGPADEALLIRGMATTPAGSRFIAARYFGNTSEDRVFYQGGGAPFIGGDINPVHDKYLDVGSPVRAVYLSQRIPYRESRSNEKLLRTVGLEVERKVETTATVRAITDSGNEQEVRTLTYPTPA